MEDKVWDNTNCGALFNKQAKKKTDRHPDYGGQINCEGVTYWLSGWIKTSRTGEKFLSLAVGQKVEPRRTAGNGAEDGQPEYNDEIPF